eukprot:6180534-Pleurochrysis_carterae.AAC.5
MRMSTGQHLKPTKNGVAGGEKCFCVQVLLRECGGQHRDTYSAAKAERSESTRYGCVKHMRHMRAGTLCKNQGQTRSRKG